MPRVDSLFNEEKGNNGMYYQVGEMKSVVFKNTNPYLIDIRFEIWFKIWFIMRFKIQSKIQFKIQFETILNTNWNIDLNTD